MNELPSVAGAVEPTLPPSRPPARGKALAGVFGVAMLAATLSPIVQNWRAEPKDSFPLSYYPMFSQKRSETYQVNYLVGLDAAGNRHVVPHKFAGSGGFNQTRRQINKVVREKRAGDLCRAVAERLGKEKRPPFSEIVTVRIVSGTFGVDDYFAGNKTPLKESVRATAKVPRGAP